MPRVQPTDGVVLGHHVGERLHVLLLHGAHHGLDQLGLAGVRKCRVLVFVSEERKIYNLKI